MVTVNCQVITVIVFFARDGLTSEANVSGSVIKERWLGSALF